MRMVWFGLMFAVMVPAQIPFSQSGFDSRTHGWARWAAREEIAPVLSVAEAPSRGDRGALAIHGGGNPASSGGWERRVGGIVAGRWYELTAWYRAVGLVQEANEIVCRLDWARADGRRAGTPDYAWKTAVEGPWRRLALTAPAPDGASAVKIQLWLHNAPQATVWWDDIRLMEAPAPAARPVRIESVYFRPRNSPGREENVKLFTALALKASAAADVILLPEGMTVVGTGLKYADVAEPVPGPTTRALGDLARKKNSYVAAGLYERDGVAIYNTAVLIDRKGNLAGRYRKVYLPREEIEAGLTPGNEYPVFDTDFGKVGLMICWDVQYADPARALALAGAQIVLLPIWGGNETLMRARAIENHVFLVASGFDVPSMILDPKGETLARTDVNGTVAAAVVDLNRRYVWEWLGEMRGRYMREVRLDVPVQRPAPSKP